MYSGGRRQEMEGLGGLKWKERGKVVGMEEQQVVGSSQERSGCQ